MTGFLIRWVLAFVLLTATYNPTEWNYWKWFSLNYKVEPAIAVLVGLLLLAGYIIYLRSIGVIGIGLVAAIVSSAIWVMIDQGLCR